MRDSTQGQTTHETEGRTTIQAENHEGTKRDAILYACGSNATNGIRRTNADKRQAVERLLGDAEWSKWSDREIARRAAVGNRFVTNIRHESSVHSAQIDRRLVTRNGTTYQQDTRNIGKTESSLLRGDLEFANQKRQERPDELTDEEIARFQETSRKEGVTEERTSIVYGVISSLEDLAPLDVTTAHFPKCGYDADDADRLGRLPRSFGPSISKSR